MACAQGGTPRQLRARPVLQCVPRTTRHDAGYETDPYVLETPAGVTAELTARGWFLVRFMKAVRQDAFDGFSSRLFRGQLPPDVAERLKEMVQLPLISSV